MVENAPSDSGNSDSVWKESGTVDVEIESLARHKWLGEWNLSYVLDEGALNRNPTS